MSAAEESFNRFQHVYVIKKLSSIRRKQIRGRLESTSSKFTPICLSYNLSNNRTIQDLDRTLKLFFTHVATVPLSRRLFCPTQSVSLGNTPSSSTREAGGKPFPLSTYHCFLLVELCQSPWNLPNLVMPA